MTRSVLLPQPDDLLEAERTAIRKKLWFLTSQHLPVLPSRHADRATLRVSVVEMTPEQHGVLTLLSHLHAQSLSSLSGQERAFLDAF
ncbi:hypothetical protein ACFFLM_00395 [Deinococcus oregonensis]|uniref:Uncharacterized protein n=1 Tax=Deinococcus oregonensis TaxID=1805970 RepID=A0ABV6ASG9_9DEIO